MTVDFTAICLTQELWEPWRRGWLKMSPRLLIHTLSLKCERQDSESSVRVKAFCRHLTDRVHLSGNVTEFFDGFTEPPLLTVLRSDRNPRARPEFVCLGCGRISHSEKYADGDNWQGLTGTIPSSATTWPYLHTL